MQIFQIEAKEFQENYKFLEKYDDYVECIKTGKVYKANYKHGLVELIETSNTAAIAKIEAGMADFVQMLVDQGFERKKD